MNGLFPLVVALISVPFWFLYNNLAKRLNGKKRETGLTQNMNKIDIVSNASSFFQKDLVKAQSDIQEQQHHNNLENESFRLQESGRSINS
jgi:hypothetical protein